MKTKITKIIYIILGFLFMGLGILGIALPILPTTPFLLLASYFFAKGSTRFHRWFLKTKLYENYLKEFIENRSMTLKRKFSILIPVSLLLISTAILIDSIYARIAISIIIVLKYYYFFSRIKTVEKDQVSISCNKI